MYSLRQADILLATTNAGKREEFAALLAPYGCNLRSLDDLALIEPEETEFTFEGNAELKAHAGALASGLPTIADDSGLVVEALGGAPGIYTADWAEGVRGRDFGLAMRKTWSLIAAVGAVARPRAWFVCDIAVVWPDGEKRTFKGRLEGLLVWPLRGETGHGYDPMFQPIGLQKTLAELSIEQKNRISHRSRALNALVSSCFT